MSSAIVDNSIVQIIEPPVGPLIPLSDHADCYRCVQPMRGVVLLRLEAMTYMIPVGQIAVLPPNQDVSIGTMDRIATTVRFTAAPSERGVVAEPHICVSTSPSGRNGSRRRSIVSSWSAEAVVKHIDQARQFAIERLPGSLTARTRTYGRLALAHSHVAADTRITGQGLAELASMSYGSFNRCFRACFGISPKQHMIAFRVRLAMSLLTEDDMPLTEIAFTCGYDDRTAFSRAFKRAVGASPSTSRPD